MYKQHTHFFVSGLSRPIPIIFDCFADGPGISGSESESESELSILLKNKQQEICNIKDSIQSTGS